MKSLSLFAGPQAMAQVQAEGFSPSQVQVLAGASGGPKWLILSALDRALFGEFFRDRIDPLQTIGSSIGSWRMSCFATPDPVAAITRLENAYIEQRYPAGATPTMVSREAAHILSELMDTHREEDLIDHPWVRLHILAVHCSGFCGVENPRLQTLGFAAVGLGNLFSRKTLARRLTRVIFHNADGGSPFLHLNDLPTMLVPLQPDNLRPALMASGSIPLVLEGVRDIPGGEAGTYRDGGVVDYHLDFDYGPGDGLVLYPHFYPYVVPGWFDKGLRWRRATIRNFERAIVIAPSAELVAQLPYGKIPDRRDFNRLDDTKRIRYWRQVVEAGERMADEFLELWVRDGLVGLMQPLFAAS
jgi:hypothetical protein